MFLLPLDLDVGVLDMSTGNNKSEGTGIVHGFDETKWTRLLDTG